MKEVDMRCGTTKLWATVMGAWMLSACVVETPSLDSLSCSGNAMTPDAQCVDGRWVAREGVEPADMPLPDLSVDMPADLEQPDLMPDLPEVDMTPDMPDLDDPCNDDRVAALCSQVMCGEPAELASTCPEARCMNSCAATQQCIANQCVQCLELGTPEMVAAAEDSALCQEAADRVVETAGESTPVQCAPGAAPAANICGLDRALDCDGICPDTMTCGSAGVCCLGDAEIKTRCEGLSVIALCGLEPATGQQVRSCDTGQLVPLGERCAGSCPLDEGRAFLGSPARGTAGLIGGHEVYPSESSPLRANTIEFWLRPSDAYFQPINGVWSAVTGPGAGDRATAMLYDNMHMSLSSDMNTELIRADMNATDQDLNFNHYVDLGGGYISFDRPQNFRGHASIFMVLRNKFGDEVDATMNEHWYTRPAVLSGEHDGGGLDFGITLNQGKFEWNRNSSDQPVFTTDETYASGQWRVLSLTRLNDDTHRGTKLFIDGSEAVSAKSPEGDYVNPTIRIGRHPDLWQDQGQWHGDVAEVILMSAALGNNPRRRVHTYLAIKYGITLEEDYYGASDQLLYDISSDGEHRIFGVMCDRDNFALTQHSSRSQDGLWQLHAGNAYVGLGSCPVTPFSIIIGDNDAPLVQDNSSVTYESSQGGVYDLEVLERTWTMRIDTQDTVPAFTMTLDLMQQDLVGSGFAPEMLLLEDGDGEELIVPLQVTADAQYKAVSWFNIGMSNLDTSTPIKVKLARFER